MTPGYSDPLEGLDTLDDHSWRVAMTMIVKNQSNSLSKVETTLTWILRTMVALLISVIGGMALLVLTHP